MDMAIYTPTRDALSQQYQKHHDSQHDILIGTASQSVQCDENVGANLQYMLLQRYDSQDWVVTTNLLRADAVWLLQQKFNKTNPMISDRQAFQNI